MTSKPGQFGAGGFGRPSSLQNVEPSRPRNNIASGLLVSNINDLLAKAEARPVCRRAVFMIESWSGLGPPTEEALFSQFFDALSQLDGEDAAFLITIGTYGAFVELCGQQIFIAHAKKRGLFLRQAFQDESKAEDLWPLLLAAVTPRVTRGDTAVCNLFMTDLRTLAVSSGLQPATVVAVAAMHSSLKEPCQGILLAMHDAYRGDVACQYEIVRNLLRFETSFHSQSAGIALHTLTQCLIQMRPPPGDAEALVSAFWMRLTTTQHPFNVLDDDHRGFTTIISGRDELSARALAWVLQRDELEALCRTVYMALPIRSKTRVWEEGMEILLSAWLIGLYGGGPAFSLTLLTVELLLAMLDPNSPPYAMVELIFRHHVGELILDASIWSGLSRVLGAAALEDVSAAVKQQRQQSPPSGAVTAALRLLKYVRMEDQTYFNYKSGDMESIEAAMILARVGWEPPSLLIDVCNHERWDLARTLIERPTQRLWKYENLVFTPLHCLARAGHTPLMRVLLDQAVDVHARLACVGEGKRAGWTPLHLAGAGGDTAAVVLLLDHGARINSGGTFEHPAQTVMQIAVERKDPGIVMALLAHGAQAFGPAVSACCHPAWQTPLLDTRLNITYLSWRSDLHALLPIRFRQLARTMALLRLTPGAPVGIERVEAAAENRRYLFARLPLEIFELVLDCLFQIIRQWRGEMSSRVDPTEQGVPVHMLHTMANAHRRGAEARAPARESGGGVPAVWSKDARRG